METDANSSQLISPDAGRLVRVTPSAVAVLAIVTGGMALAGWAADISALKSVLPGCVSVKPNTALGFILTGIALLCSSHRLTVLSRPARLCGWLAGLIGLLTLIEYSGCWIPGFDQWLFSEPAGTVGTSHPGRMAPDTALCFLLLAVGLEIACTARQRKRMLTGSAVFGMLALVLALVEILSYFTPDFRTHGWWGLTKMALPTAVLFALLGMAMFLVAWRQIRLAAVLSAKPMETLKTHAGLKFLIVFFLLAMGILSTGAFYYQSYEQRYRTQMEQQLSVIADMKVEELAQWRKERLGGATVFFKNAAFSRLVRRFLDNQGDTAAQEEIREWLNSVYTGERQYDQLRLLATDGTPLLAATTNQLPTSASVLKCIPEVLRSGQTTFVDFYRHASNRNIYLTVMVPIFDEKDRRRPLGVVTMRIDPRSFVYPFIKRWPMLSRSAETLLVRREGNEAVFLNELRFQANTALNLRIPLDQTAWPVAHAVLGEKIVMEGADYRGVSVLAATRTIPGSPWALVAHMDTAEAFGPLRRELWEILELIGALLISAGAAVGLVWRQQRLRLYREQLKTAEALRESEEQLSLVLKGSQLGSWDWNIETGHVLRNETWATMLGYTLEEYNASIKDWKNLCHPDDLTAVEKSMQAHLEGRTPMHQVEYRMRGKDGQYRWILDQAKVVKRDPLGHPLRMTGIHIDTTASKRIEVALQASEQRFRALIEHGHDAIVLLAADGTVLYDSPSFFRLMGYTPAERLGRNTFEFAHPDERQSLVRGFAAFVQQKSAVASHEARFLHKDGTPRLFEVVRTNLLHDPDVRAVVVNFHDITESRLLEEQHRQAMKMEAVGRLAGGVAHDFNNMLGVIIGHVDLALERVDPAQPIHADLKEIREAANRSVSLTRHLLAFARKQTIAPRVLNLNETVAGMLKMLHRLIGENINLNWHPAANLWMTKADLHQVDQILTNLCINARDAIKGVGEITIETKNITLDKAYCSDHLGFMPGEYVRLDVTDNGCGMDRETRTHIFEPFYTTKTSGAGTGLGLATVYGAVKQNNGFINVYSEPGHGTTFAIYLPRHRMDEASRGELPAEALQASVQGHETILLVEDEVALLKLTMSMLERRGYIVLAASTPGEAMRLREKYAGEVHLLITDVVMPGMNGRELSMKLQAIYPKLKCLYMSGYTANVIVHHGVLYEGVHFIQKPFSARDLAAKVREVLDHE